MNATITSTCFKCLGVVLKFSCVNQSCKINFLHVQETIFISYRKFLLKSLNLIHFSKSNILSYKLIN